MCCSVLQSVAVCCSVKTDSDRCNAYTAVVTFIARWTQVRYSVLQRVAACCSVLQCVATCCRVFQCVAVEETDLMRSNTSTAVGSIDGMADTRVL